MSRTHLVVLLVVLVLAALVVLLQGPPMSSTREDVAIRPTPADPSAGVRLEGSARPTDERGAKPAGSVGTEGEEEEAQGPKVWLRGTVSVADDRVVSAFDPPLVISVYPKQLIIDSIIVFFPIEAKLEAPGAFAVDLTYPCREMKKWGRDDYVVLAADHPDYADLERRIPVPDVDALLAGTATFDPVDLVLQPVGAVTGVVEDVEGRPRPGAKVLLYRVVDGVPESHPVDEVVTAEGGLFRARSAGGGKHLVVATHAQYADNQLHVVARPAPASRVVDVRVDRVTDGVRLRLRPSYRVRGIVRLAGRAAGGAHLEWRLQRGAHPLRYGKNPDPEWEDYIGLAYADREAHWAWEEGRTDGAGRFEILGPSALPYRLRIRDVGGALLHHEDEKGTSVIVTPPDDHVEIDVPAARLRLRVLDGDAPVQPTSLRMAAIGRFPGLADTVDEDDYMCWNSCQGEADEDGRFEIALSPGCTYAVQVEHEGYAQYDRILTAPATGETLDLTVPLRPAAPKPRLLVTLESPAGEAPDFAGFGFYPVDVDPTSCTASPTRDVKAVEGRFLLEDLRPGPQRLHVRPGRRWNGRPNDWLESTLQVDAPPEGTATYTVAIEKGGRLQVTATDVEGRHLEATCTILDATGAEVPAWFRAEDSIGGTIMSTSHLPGVGACWVDAALPAGRYRVRLEAEGYEPQTHEVEVEPGRPAAVNAVLETLR